MRFASMVIIAFLTVAVSAHGQVNCEQSNIILGELGEWNSVKAAGTQMKSTYPVLSYWHKGGSIYVANEDSQQKLLKDQGSASQAQGIKRGNPQWNYGRAIYVHNTDNWIQFGPLAAGNVIFDLLTTEAPANKSQWSGTIRVHFFNAQPNISTNLEDKPDLWTNSNTNRVAYEDWSVDNSNTYYGRRLVWCVNAVQNYGYVVISAPTSAEPFYVDNFQAGGGQIPVELTSFRSYLKEDIVELNWTTATEINNQGFWVERSLDQGDTWDQLEGFVQGAGNSSVPLEYGYSDWLNADEMNLSSIAYRLRQVDRDGTIDYSSMVYVHPRGAAEQITLHEAYPNPFNPSTNLSFTLTESMQVTLRVFDILGQPVTMLLDNQEMKAGYHSIPFDGENLTSGAYFIAFEAGDIIQYQRIVLNK